MSVSVQQLEEELQIFGLEYEKALTEKRESFALSPDPSLGPCTAGSSRLPRTQGGALLMSIPLDQASQWA